MDTGCEKVFTELSERGYDIMSCVVALTDTAGAWTSCT